MMAGQISATDLLAGWPVPNAALAVVGPDGLLGTEGDIDHRFWLASVTKPLT